MCNENVPPAVFGFVGENKPREWEGRQGTETTADDGRLSNTYAMADVVRDYVTAREVIYHLLWNLSYEMEL